MAIANSDGSIVLSTKVVTDGIDKALKSIKNKFAALKEEKATIAAITEDIKVQKERLQELNKEYAQRVASGQAGTSELKKEIELETKALKELETAATTLGKKSTKSLGDMSNGLKKFGERIAGIIKSALIFSVLYKVMQAVVKLFQNILMSDEQFRQDWEELKAAFYTAAYPIINLIVPAIKWIVQQVRDWAISIGKVAAALQGMSYSELVDQAKASKEAADNYSDMEKSSKKTADNVKKQLASFDDIQILSSGNDKEQGAGLAGFEGLKEYDTSGEKSMLDDLMTAIGGALVAVGLILLFKGQIPWGIGFIVAGAAIWAITKFATGEFSEDPIVNMLIKIMGIAGTALAALGIILLVFGQIPWGIAMLATGAVMLVTALALNNEAIVNKVKEVFNAIIDWIKTYGLLVLGIILCLTGAGIPFGIALIVKWAKDGAEKGVPLAAAIVDKVKEIWDAVKQFWNTYIAPVFTARFWLELGKKGLNGLIEAFELALNIITGGMRGLVNGSIQLINSIGGLIGLDWDIPQIPKISLPRLAQGAVIPPNREFLAVLGDQKQGVNIEAPLQTIVDAFNIALEQNNGYNSGRNTEVVLEIDGREFGRAVVEQGNRENRRIGTKLVIV